MVRCDGEGVRCNGEGVRGGGEGVRCDGACVIEVCVMGVHVCIDCKACSHITGPVARGVRWVRMNPPPLLKNHQPIKNKSKRALKEYVALFRPTRYLFPLFRCSIITKRHPERYLIAIGLHFVMMSFTIKVTFCTMYSVTRLHCG